MNESIENETIFVQRQKVAATIASLQIMKILDSIEPLTALITAQTVLLTVVNAAVSPELRVKFIDIFSEKTRKFFETPNEKREKDE